MFLSFLKIAKLLMAAFVAVIAVGTWAPIFATRAVREYAISPESAIDTRTPAYGVLTRYCESTNGLKVTPSPVAFAGEYVTVSIEPGTVVCTRRHPNGLPPVNLITTRVFHSKEDAERGCRILAVRFVSERFVKAAETAMR